jgi:hypothetical protein
MENIELKSSATSFVGSVLGMMFGWIDVNLAQETIQVAVISTIIGYLGGKLLAIIDKFVSEKFSKKKPKIKRE